MSNFTPNSIALHLKEYLPSLTDLFTDKISVAAQIIAGTPQTLRITQPAHGYATGNSIITVDGLINNPITAVSAFTDPNGDTGFRFTTNKGHDLTLDYVETVKLSGFTNSAFNSTFPLSGVPSRTLFEILSSETLPILNGNEVSQEFWEIGINGLFEITVVDANTYDILLADRSEFETGAVPQLSVITSNRISVAASFERAEAIYTQNKFTDPWLFVIMGDYTLSKDRNIESDATMTIVPTDDQRQRSINTFSLNTFISTVDDIAGGDAQELAWSEIYTSLLGSMSGVKLNPFDNSNFVSIMVDHGSTIYNTAYYGHAYTFEVVYDITDLNTFIEQFKQTRAFRDIAISLAEPEDGSNINLDEE